MALFGFGAFATPVGALIEQATDNSASAGNLALHLRICDAVNDSDTGPKEAVNAIRKRFTGSAKNYHIINLTLTVLETCVKNCGIRFHSKVAQKDFLKDLMSVIQPKNNPPTIVRERVLGLVQYWVDAFKDKPQLSAVGELYGQLKDEGVEFPPMDLDTLAPVETQDRGSTESSSNRGGQLELVQPSSGGGMTDTSGSRSVGSAGTGRPRPQGPIGSMRPEQVAKLLSELDVIRTNMDIMNEILLENEPGKEGEEDFSLMQDLNTTLRSMQERATELIGRGISEEIVLESLLQINDELNSCFTRYERHMKNRQAILSPAVDQPKNGEEMTSFSPLPPPPVAADISLPAVTYPSLDQPPSYDEGGEAGVGQLIDLGLDTPGTSSTAVPPPLPQGGDTDLLGQLSELGISSNQQPPPTVRPPQTSPGLDQSDEFNIFAQSRLAYSTGGSTYEDNIEQQGTSLSSAVHRQPQPTDQNTYANVQSFMVQTPPTTTQEQTTSDDQVTSAEFDQFLAERASKSKHRPQMQMQEETTDAMFEL